MFGVIGSIFTVILFLYIIFSVLSGNVLYNLKTEKNVYPGRTFLFGFILALIVTGSFYLDYKYNDLKGGRMVIEKVISFFNKE